MRADALAYSRAANVSLFGIGAQIVLWLALLAYGLFGRDPLASSAAWMTLIGLPAWVGLLLTFHQHKLERLEDAEAEAYAGSTAQQVKPLRAKRRGSVPNRRAPAPRPGTRMMPGPSPSRLKCTVRPWRSTVGMAGTIAGAGAGAMVRPPLDARLVLGSRAT